VQAQYQRRSDLVPNLVATVTGEAQQERAVLFGVTQARAKATSITVDANTLTDPAAFQRFQQAQDQLSGALSHLLAIREAYPDLKSNEAFQTLMSQLEGTENRIAIARRDYNDAVRDYQHHPCGAADVDLGPHVLRRRQPAALRRQAHPAPQVQFNLNGAQPGAPPGSTPPAPTPANAATP
jgi:LemA protein